MKVYFLNDTTSFHAGSAAVMNAFRHWLKNINVIHWNQLGENELNEDAWNSSDAVIVNGEGSINHTSPRAIFLMESIGKAQKAGKKTFLFNTIFQGIRSDWEDTFRNLDYVCCREPRSAMMLKEYCGREPEVLVDFCLAGIEENGFSLLNPVPPCLKGTTWPWSDYHGIIDHINIPSFKLTPEVRFADIIATLAKTKLYITGRHHGVYAAGAANIPFITIPSNTHKIESLIEWSKIPIPICRTKEDVETAVNNREQLIESGHLFHDFLMTEKQRISDRVESVLEGLRN